jgi:addiction module HigA family antidote
LKDELEALGLSARKFAAHIGVPPNAITEILNGDRGVTAEMALRLGAAFNLPDGRFWMNLQSNYDAKLAREKMRDKIAAIEPLVTA